MAGNHDLTLLVLLLSSAPRSCPDGSAGCLYCVCGFPTMNTHKHTHTHPLLAVFGCWDLLATYLVSLTKEELSLLFDDSPKIKSMSAINQKAFSLPFSNGLNVFSPISKTLSKERCSPTSLANDLR